VQRNATQCNAGISKISKRSLADTARQSLLMLCNAAIGACWCPVGVLLSDKRRRSLERLVQEFRRLCCSRSRPSAWLTVYCSCITVDTLTVALAAVDIRQCKQQRSASRWVVKKCDGSAVWKIILVRLSDSLPDAPNRCIP
jgi:hypothetical protein